MDGQRHASLLALYGQVRDEIDKLRDFEWKIAATFVTLSGGFVVLTCSDSFRPLLTTPLRWVLTVALVLAMVFGVYSLIITHVFLTRQRAIRRTIEGALGFYGEGFFVAGPILPGEWKSKPVTFRFQALGLLLPLMLTVTVVVALTVCLIWLVPEGKPAQPGSLQTADRPVVKDAPEAKP